MALAIGFPEPQNKVDCNYVHAKVQEMSAWDDEIILLQKIIADCGSIGRIQNPVIARLNAEIAELEAKIEGGHARIGMFM